MGGTVLGVQLGGLVQIGQGRIELVLVGQQKSAGSHHGGATRCQSDGLVEIGHLLVGFLLQTGPQRERFGAGHRIVEPQFERLVDRLARLLDLSSRQQMQLRDQQVRFRLFGVQLDGLLEIGQRKLAFLAKIGRRSDTGENLLDRFVRPLDEGRDQQLISESGVRFIESLR